MKSRSLGRGGPQISMLGLGCMALSGVYGAADEREGIALIQSALDQGITLLDTGDFYAMGHNEMLLGQALQGRREQAFVQVKFGVQRDPRGQHIGYDLRPASIRNYLSYSLKRLRTDYVDLYQPARMDPSVPLEDVIGTLADLVKAGWVRHIGMSEVGAETLRKAHALHPIAALQIEYSVITRDIEKDILPTCRELGISVVPYGVLSRGLLGGNVSAETLQKAGGDMRTQFPRFQGDNLTRNLALTERLAAIAGRRGATAAELAIAWVLGRGEDIVPVIGARRADQLQALINAPRIELTAAEYAEIEAAVPPHAAAGHRYSQRGAQQIAKS